MAHTVRPHLPHTEPSPADVRLHAADTPHRRMDVLAWACLLLGVASFAIAGAGGHLVGVVIGVVGFGLSAAAQMLSVTTAERWLIVPGWALSFLGALMNLFFMYN